ncbi:THUMP domain-containing protein [Candidatus Aenigmatarchaeota archaeon]
MVDANLVVTYEPAHISSAEREVRALISDTRFLKSPVEGVFLLKTKKDAKKVVEKVKKTCENDPSLFQYTFNWVPIEKWVDSKLTTVVKTMKAIDKKIDPKKSWKLEINKRLYNKSVSEMIKKFTDPINKPIVDLKKPQQVIRIEIIKNKAGISLLSPEQLLNVPNTKR